VQSRNRQEEGGLGGIKASNTRGERTNEQNWGRGTIIKNRRGVVVCLKMKEWFRGKG